MDLGEHKGAHNGLTQRSNSLPDTIYIFILFILSILIILSRSQPSTSTISLR